MKKQILHTSLALFFVGFASTLNSAEQQPPSYNKKEELRHLTSQATKNLQEAQQQRRELVDEKLLLVNIQNGYEGIGSLPMGELRQPFCKVMYHVAKDLGMRMDGKYDFVTDQKPREILAIMQAHLSGQAASVLYCFLDNTNKAHATLDELLSEEVDEGLRNFFNGTSDLCPTRFLDHIFTIGIKQ